MWAGLSVTTVITIVTTLILVNKIIREVESSKVAQSVTYVQ